MLIVGLTGSIGMGKSTIADNFRKRGIAVFDADAHVHGLYAGEAAPLVEAAFPGTTAQGCVDRAKLADALKREPQGFARLEAIVHPLVVAAERDFLKREAARGAAMVVVDIPLLFESGRDKKVDAIVVASAPPATQRERVLARPGMTEARLEALLARQIPDAEKRARADFIVDTGGSHEESGRQVDAIIDTLAGREGRAFEAFWA